LTTLRVGEQKGTEAKDIKTRWMSASRSSKTSCGVNASKVTSRYRSYEMICWIGNERWKEKVL